MNQQRATCTKSYLSMFPKVNQTRKFEGKLGDDYVDAESLLKLLELRAKMLSNVLFDILKTNDGQIVWLR